MNLAGIDGPFQLTPESVPAYLTAIGLARAEERCVARELGGGVSNIVLLVEWPDAPERRWVVKQSLEKLRVEDDWRSERGRIFREAEALEALQPILSRSLPQVIHIDRQNYLYVMTAAPPGSVAWKECLLAGRRVPGIAAQAGVLLARMIDCEARSGVPKRNPAIPAKGFSYSASLPTQEERHGLGSESETLRLRRQLERRFADRTVFDQLRIDPYYRTAAARHPDVAPVLQRLIEDSWQIRTSLVHGDYSPKNMLVRDGKIVLIDFEVVHWGDPAFDAAFLLNHLSLKVIHQPHLLELYIEEIWDFWNALEAQLGLPPDSDFEYMTVRHLGGLMLARIDGKSPVEYIRDDKQKNCVRGLAKRIIFENPRRLRGVVEMLQSCKLGST